MKCIGCQTVHLTRKCISIMGSTEGVVYTETRFLVVQYQTALGALQVMMFNHIPALSYNVKCLCKQFNNTTSSSLRSTAFI